MNKPKYTKEDIYKQLEQVYFNLSDSEFDKEYCEYEEYTFISDLFYDLLNSIEESY